MTAYKLFCLGPPLLALDDQPVKLEMRKSLALLFYLDEAPHDWLFPRCNSVVHHGRTGTTAADLREGIPNIVIPHGIDHLFWGRRIAAIAARSVPIDILASPTPSNNPYEICSFPR